MFLPSLSARERGKNQRSQSRRPFVSPLSSSSSQEDFYYYQADDEEEFGGGEDERRRRDPDEIAFLSSRDIGSVESVDATSSERNSSDNNNNNNHNNDDNEDMEESSQQNPFGIRERFGRLLANTFRKKWDSKPASLKGLDQRDVPRHIAIIMDGNARWAERRRLPPRVGHENGVESLRAVVRCASAWGIKVVSVYTFSIENWSRGPPEVDGLLELLETTLREDAENLMRNDVKVVVMGDLSRVKPSLRLAVEETVEMTKNNQGVVLNVALSYGGRQDIVNAAKDMAEAVKFGSLRIEDISQETFMRYLGTANVLTEGEEEEIYESFDDHIPRSTDDSLGDYAGVGERYMRGHNNNASSSSTSASPSSTTAQQQEKGNLSSLRAARSLQNPDLLIRTSGEQRLSNFMLFEMAYTELYFTDAMWPEFGEAELRRAIFSYAKRDRRFGSRAAKVSTSSDANEDSATRVGERGGQSQGPPPGGFGRSLSSTTSSSGSVSANTNTATNAGGGARSQQPSSGSINALTLGGETNVLNSKKNSDINEQPSPPPSSSSQE